MSGTPKSFGADWSSYKDSFFSAAESTANQFGRDQIGFIIAGVIALLLISGSSAQLVCALVGFAYPAYASVKDLRAPTQAGLTRWLIYWTVFACFCLIDHLTVVDYIMRKLPFLYLTKAAALVFLYHPQTRGAEYCFATYIVPAVTMAEAWLIKQCTGAQQ